MIERTSADPAPTLASHRFADHCGLKRVDPTGCGGDGARHRFDLLYPLYPLARIFRPPAPIRFLVGQCLAACRAIVPKFGQGPHIRFVG
jgi:hypothetical protein